MPRRKHAVPPDLQDRAVVTGLSPCVRTWGAGLNPAFEQELMESAPRERAWRARLGQADPLPPAEYLAISGGGQNGAFAAGLLTGWTAAGNRPQFKAVTGISTGALIAPLAYLGPEYDDRLRACYTQVSTRDILAKRNPLIAVFRDALADNRPLWRLVECHLDQKALNVIAEEHGKGRLLLIGTTNLDAQRAVIWNLGAIAASQHPHSLELVRKVVIASTSIPVVFPPMMFDVEVQGTLYQEMHVDGGATTQVFLYPPSLKLKEKAEAGGMQRQRRLYIIRNARLNSDCVETRRRTLSIAGRTVSAVINTQGFGDLFRTYLNAQRDGIDYNLVSIPESFKAQARESFDREYMQTLFDVGFEMGQKGGFWEKAPPAFEG